MALVSPQTKQNSCVSVLFNLIPQRALASRMTVSVTCRGMLADPQKPLLRYAVCGWQGWSRLWASPNTKHREYARTYIHTYIHTHAYMCVYIYMYICIYIFLHTYLHIYIHLIKYYTYIYADMHACMHACMRASKQTYILTHHLTSASFPFRWRALPLLNSPSFPYHTYAMSHGHSENYADGCNAAEWHTSRVSCSTKSRIP